MEGLKSLIGGVEYEYIAMLTESLHPAIIQGLVCKLRAKR